VNRYSEATYFRNLIRACHQNKAGKAYGTFLYWLARAYPGTPVEQFLERAEDGELIRQLSLLATQLYTEAENEEWSGKRFAICLKNNRQIASSRRKKHKQLPMLNP